MGRPRRGQQRKTAAAGCRGAPARAARCRCRCRCRAGSPVGAAPWEGAHGSRAQEAAGPGLSMAGRRRRDPRSRPGTGPGDTSPSRVSGRFPLPAGASRRPPVRAAGGVRGAPHVPGTGGRGGPGGPGLPVPVGTCGGAGPGGGGAGAGPRSRLSGGSRGGRSAIASSPRGSTGHRARDTGHRHRAPNIGHRHRARDTGH